jgi:hypothetical protein
VRVILAIATLWISVYSAIAQNQEQKLIDRLLRPNVSVKNSAQDKKFTNTSSAVFDKPARTHSFYSPDKSVAKSYPDDRVFTSQQFAARHFRGGDSAANVATRSQLTKNDTMVPTGPAPGVRVAPETVQTTAATREFSGNRPFLVEGKSQKALHAHDRPMTIEQVRELLNKSK